MTMDVKTEKRVPLERALVKVLAVIIPAQIASHFFPAHASVAWSIGAFLGLIPWYFIPPRVSIKYVFVAVMGCLLASAIVLLGSK